MKSLRHATHQLLIVFASYGSAFCSPDSGFFLPDSVNEMTLRYRSIKNLIVLPVVINDSITVNLILDTGCRNLVLFGKRFEKLFNSSLSRKVQFSGLGSGKPVQGYLSLSNKVAIHQVLGERIPIVVVPNKNVMAMYRNVHGVIGYEIFFKFEIELNPQAETITFRPAMRANAPFGFFRVPLRIVDCRPVINSEVQMDSDTDKKYDMMIDTGSTLGLLVKTTSMDRFNSNSSRKIIGIGFNGAIYGYKIQVGYISLEGFVINNLLTGVIESPWHNYASIGMEVLKDYIVVINYYKSYACFKKLSNV
jgi:predicted aspartyl protease